MRDIPTIIGKSGQQEPANPPPLPTRAERLANGNMLISDQFNHQVIEITTTNSPVMVASYGTINTAGSSTTNAKLVSPPYRLT